MGQTSLSKYFVLFTLAKLIIILFLLPQRHENFIKLNIYRKYNISKICLLFYKILYIRFPVIQNLNMYIQILKHVCISSIWHIIIIA